MDYIFQHMKKDGRAGIVVPDGILSNSNKAYRQIRKTLVEDHLSAIVSLPSGVFNPHSGVKTSILFLNKKKAASVGNVLFLTAENDGLSLTTRRSPIKQNDLPKLKEALTDWMNGKMPESTGGKIKVIGRHEILDRENFDLVRHWYDR